MKIYLAYMFVCFFVMQKKNVFFKKKMFFFFCSSYAQFRPIGLYLIDKIMSLPRQNYPIAIAIMAWPKNN